MKQQFDAFIEDLRATHGANLAAVVLYGSGATGEFTPRQSNYNLLIALNQITPADLRAAQAPMREWQRLGHPLPTYFTLSELHDAADVFPIEFDQMSRARLVLYGSDPLAEIEFSDANLRHQTEYELRSKLLQLRRLYIPASVSASKLQNLMTESLASFVALFRAVLLLHGGNEPPVTKRQIIKAAAERAGLDNAPFETILSWRENPSLEVRESTAHEIFAAYLAQIERTIEFVDKIND